MRLPWADRLLHHATPVPGAPLLEVEGLTVRYGEIAAVRDLSFSIGEGEVLALLGPNGAGKSSTLRALSGLLKPAAGTIRFRGQPIDHMPAESIARLGLTHPATDERMTWDSDPPGDFKELLARLRGGAT